MNAMVILVLVAIGQACFFVAGLRIGRREGMLLERARSVAVEVRKAER